MCCGWFIAFEPERPNENKHCDIYRGDIERKEQRNEAESNHVPKEQRKRRYLVG